MNINIDYTGTIGSGTIAIEIAPEGTIKELLTTFHKATATDDFYTIQGGAPPHRRAMKVSYDYYINGKRLRNNIHDEVTTLGLTSSETMTLRIDKGLRVD